MVLLEQPCVRSRARKICFAGRIKVTYIYILCVSKYIARFLQAEECWWVIRRTLSAVSESRECTWGELFPSHPPSAGCRCAGVPGVDLPQRMDGVVRDAILEPLRVGTHTVTWKVTYLVVNKDVCSIYRIPRLQRLRSVSRHRERSFMRSVCVNLLENIFPLITGSTIIYGIYELHMQQFYVVNYRDIKVSVCMYDYLERVSGHENKDVCSIVSVNWKSSSKHFWNWTDINVKGKY